jgi:hypothetical protein
MKIPLYHYQHWILSDVEEVAVSYFKAFSIKSVKEGVKNVSNVFRLD